MTFEELKAEAKRQGYHLVPDKPYEKIKPCKCGNNQREHVHRYSKYDDLEYGLRCKKCGFTVWTFTENALRKEWNAEVTK